MALIDICFCLCFYVLVCSHNDGVFSAWFDVACITFGGYYRVGAGLGVFD